MRLSLIPILLFLMPLAEIAGFIIVGKMIGVWATLALVILQRAIGRCPAAHPGLRRPAEAFRPRAATAATPDARWCMAR